MTLGSLILVPSIAGFGSLAYYVYGQTFSLAWALGLGTLWCLFVMLIDRAILATYHPLADGFVSKAAKITVRAILVVVIGVAIAHPLTLLNFRTAIRERWALKQNEQIAALKKQREELVETVRITASGRESKVNQDLEQLDKEITGIRAKKTQMLLEIGRDAATGTASEHATAQAKLAENRGEQDALRTEKTAKTVEMNNHERYYNQEYQFGLNEKHDGINPSNEAERRTKTARKAGKAFSSAEILGDPVTNTPSKAPRMKEFIDTVNLARGRIEQIDVKLADLQKRERVLDAQIEELSARMGDEQAKFAKLGVEKVNAGIENELAPKLAARLLLEKKLRDFQTGNDVAIENDAARALDTLIEESDARVDQIKAGTLVLDSWEQTQLLWLMITDPRKLGDSHPNENMSLGMKIVGTFEVLRYFLIFMALDVIVLAFKVLRRPGEYDYHVDLMRRRKEQQYLNEIASMSGSRLSRPDRGEGPSRDY